MILLVVILTALMVEYNNASFAKILAMTYSDSMADSVAVYSQSYDYQYNKGQARTMLETLTEYNQQYTPYQIDTEISFPDDNVLTVSCSAEIPTVFSALTGRDKITAIQKTTVRSVDVYKDIFVVP